MRLRDLGLTPGRIAYLAFLLLPFALIQLSISGPAIREAARRWLPFASSGKAVAVQESRDRLARADDDVARAAARVVAVKEAADSVAAESRRSLHLAQELQRRVRVVAPTRLAVEITPGATPSVVEVPAPVVERLSADSSAIAALASAVKWQDTLAAAQQARIVADSSAREAATGVEQALERQGRRRCGMRCGVVVGVTALLGVSIGVQAIRSAVR